MFKLSLSSFCRAFLHIYKNDFIFTVIAQPSLLRFLISQLHSKSAKPIYNIYKSSEFDFLPDYNVLNRAMKKHSKRFGFDFRRPNLQLINSRFSFHSKNDCV
jgi:hypothetical protein